MTREAAGLVVELHRLQVDRDAARGCRSGSAAGRCAQVAELGLQLAPGLRAASAVVAPVRAVLRSARSAAAALGVGGRAGAARRTARRAAPARAGCDGTLQVAGTRRARSRLARRAPAPRRRCSWSAGARPQPAVSRTRRSQLRACRRRSPQPCWRSGSRAACWRGRGWLAGAAGSAADAAGGRRRPGAARRAAARAALASAGRPPWATATRRHRPRRPASTAEAPAAIISLGVTRRVAASGGVRRGFGSHGALSAGAARP